MIMTSDYDFVSEQHPQRLSVLRRVGMNVMIERGCFQSNSSFRGLEVH